jgi:hypothetical protein
MSKLHTKLDKVVCTLYIRYYPFSSCTRYGPSTIKLHVEDWLMVPGPALQDFFSEGASLSDSLRNTEIDFHVWSLELVYSLCIVEQTP